MRCRNSGAQFCLHCGQRNLLCNALPLVLFATVALVGGIGFRLRLSKASNCRSIGRSVEYLGSEGTCHSFKITSQVYAIEFIKANHRKIVNGAESRLNLRNTRFGDYQVRDACGTGKYEYQHGRKFSAGPRHKPPSKYYELLCCACVPASYAELVMAAMLDRWPYGSTAILQHSQAIRYHTLALAK